MTERINMWVADLHGITRATKDAPVTPETLATCARLLGNGDIPIAAFTDASLGAVAAEFKFWPTYAELRSAIMTWWKQHQPQPTRPQTPHHDNDELSNEDRRWLDYYWRRKGEIEADGYRSQRIGGNAARDFENLCSLIRGRSWQAWITIHPEAARTMAIDQAEREAIVARFRASMPIDLKSRPLPDEPPVSTFERQLKDYDALTPDDRTAWRKARGLRSA